MVQIGSFLHHKVTSAQDFNQIGGHVADDSNPTELALAAADAIDALRAGNYGMGLPGVIWDAEFVEYGVVDKSKLKRPAGQPILDAIDRAEKRGSTFYFIMDKPRHIHIQLKYGAKNPSES